jgi:hypothetical protein
MTSRTCISERLRLPVISVVAVSVLALSGCSGGGEPQAGPTATAVASPAASGSGSASATPSATPTPKPTPVYKPADAKGRAQNVPVPVKPALADKNTKEGLEAFAKYWFSLCVTRMRPAISSRGERDGATAASVAMWQTMQSGIRARPMDWQVGVSTHDASATKFRPTPRSQQVLCKSFTAVTSITKRDRTVGSKHSAGSNTAVVLIAMSRRTVGALPTSTSFARPLAP